MIRRCIALAALTALLGGSGAVRAGDHVASPETVKAQLQAASAQRAERLARVDAVLARPEAVSTARALGADAERLRAALPTLSDGELADLAARAAALDADPVAGLDPDIRLLLIVFLIVAIVVLLLEAVD